MQHELDLSWFFSLWPYHHCVKYTMLDICVDVSSCPYMKMVGIMMSWWWWNGWICWIWWWWWWKWWCWCWWFWRSNLWRVSGMLAVVERCTWKRLRYEPCIINTCHSYHRHHHHHINIFWSSAPLSFLSSSSKISIYSDKWLWCWWWWDGTTWWLWS